jgi:hypothetical protein
MTMEKSYRLRSWKSKLKSANPFSRSTTTFQASATSTTTGLDKATRGQCSLLAPDAAAPQSPATTLAPAASTTFQTHTHISASHEHMEQVDIISKTQPQPAPPTTQTACMVPSQSVLHSAERHTTQIGVVWPSQHLSNFASTSTETRTPHLPQEASLSAFVDQTVLPRVPHPQSQTPTLPVNQEAIITEIPLGATQSTTLSPPKAERFLDALTALKENHSKEFKRLEDGWKAYQNDESMQAIDISQLKLPQSVLNQPQSRELISRMKRFLPVIATVKASVMVIAALDPHKIAPICCAVLFTTGEVRHYTFIKLNFNSQK